MGEPGWSVVMWLWETSKIISRIDLQNKEGIPKQLDSGSTFMMSIQIASIDTIVTVTGPNFFHSMKIAQDSNAFEMKHS